MVSWEVQELLRTETADVDAALKYLESHVLQDKTKNNRIWLINRQKRIDEYTIIVGIHTVYNKN